MSWEGITAIATSTTVVVALGVPLMMWLLTKPKVKLLEASPIGWSFIYKNGKDLVGARLTVRIKISNNGTEKTTIKGFFTSSNKIFHLETPITLEGHGTTFDSIIHLDLSLISNSIMTNKNSYGILSLEPWGNRGLLFGHKYLTAELDIPENQGERMRQ